MTEICDFCGRITLRMSHKYTINQEQLQDSLRISIGYRSHTRFTAKKSRKERYFRKMQLKSDVAYRLVGVFEQHFRLQQRARVEPLHHRLSALLPDDR